MKTYVTIYHSPEGVRASEVAKKLEELGCVATIGQNDYVYDWKRETVGVQEVLGFVDKVQTKLKGCGVLLHFMTV